MTNPTNLNTLDPEHPGLIHLNLIQESAFVFAFDRLVFSVKALALPLLCRFTGAKSESDPEAGGKFGAEAELGKT